MPEITYEISNMSGTKFKRKYIIVIVQNLCSFATRFTTLFFKNKMHAEFALK